ncbi:MAG: toxin-antitoxin system HicB family antitoxin [Chlorobi bacterium]|nr:toxin-antitoxin system HicB family antitoxin [Chlorobiota bacterium]
MKKKKDLDYYMSLEYDTGIHKFTEEEGEGYHAYIPLLGASAVIGDGATADEALAELEHGKRWFIEYCLEKGHNIPEPPTTEEKKYSGRFMTRVPKELHKQLAKKAEAQGVSMNLYVNNILARAN